MSHFCSRNLVLAVLFLSAVFSLCSARVQAEEASYEGYHQPSRDSALASDHNHNPPSPEAVAREVLQIQQQMGGSIVTDRTGLQDWDPREDWDQRGRDHARSPVTPRQAPRWSASPPPQPTRPARHLDSAQPVNAQPVNPQPVNKVAELREAAWQLDTTAHRLEKMDLYEQADALREVATRLRRDARLMKQQTGSTRPTPVGRFATPSP